MFLFVFTLVATGLTAAFCLIAIFASIFTQDWLHALMFAVGLALMVCCQEVNFNVDTRSRR